MPTVHSVHYVVVHAHLPIDGAGRISQTLSRTVLSITGDRPGSLQSSPQISVNDAFYPLTRLSTLDVPCLDAYPDSFHECHDLFSWRNEARPVQLLSTFAHSAGLARISQRMQ